MNRLVLLLAATTLTFTATAIYYARALSVEKARQSRTELQTAAERSEAVGGTDSAPAPVTGKADATGAGKRHDPAEDAVARYQLARLRDPAGRAERKEQGVEFLRDAYGPHARGIGMAHEELDRLVEAMAERNLVRAQRRLECQVDPACDEKALTQAGSRQDLAELLGPEMYARFQAFSESSRERGQVADLRSQLTAPNALSDAQADRLITALSAERQKYATAAAQNGLELQGQIFGPAAGLSLQSASTRGATDPFAERVESATRYNQRILEIASTVLTAGQLAELKVMQGNKLQEYEELLREEAIRDSVHKAMGREP
jgi:hypothetical protein